VTMLFVYMERRVMKYNAKNSHGGEIVFQQNVLSCSIEFTIMCA
jgi:hypothetical protein